MIDFNRFWAEEGCLPGMSKAQSEAYVRDLASEQGVTAEELSKSFPHLSRKRRPGVTTENIRNWERKRGVRLPEVLREAFARQDGGFVRETTFRILPLAKIAPPDSELRECLEYDENEIPDQTRFLRFAEDAERDETYFLNYGITGARGEPSVFEWHSDPGELTRCAKSVTKFLDRMIETFDAPSVDWSQTEAVKVLARETIDESAVYRAPAEREQILGRLGETLVLFVRERTPHGETLSKLTIAEPLAGEMTMIWPGGPATETCRLQIYPRNPDGVVGISSERTSDGRWKNHQRDAVPMFDSRNRESLVAIRRTLLGDEVASQVEQQHDALVRRGQQMVQLQQVVKNLRPEQQQAAAMQLFLHMGAEFGLTGAASQPEIADPRLARIRETMQEKLREMQEKARKFVEENPVNPEISRLMQQIKQLRPGDEPDKRK
jgi:hypothetical protein